MSSRVFPISRLVPSKEVGLAIFAALVLGVGIATEQYLILVLPALRLLVWQVETNRA